MLVDMLNDMIILRAYCPVYLQYFWSEELSLKHVEFKFKSIIKHIKDYYRIILVDWYHYTIIPVFSLLWNQNHLSFIDSCLY